MACYARTMMKAKQNYDIHDKKLLAIVKAFWHWKIELQEMKIQVIVLSDHQNLQYFTMMK